MGFGKERFTSYVERTAQRSYHRRGDRYLTELNVMEVFIVGGCKSKEGFLSRVATVQYIIFFFFFLPSCHQYLRVGTCAPIRWLFNRI